MDDAKRPAPETVNFSSCRIVSVRAVPAASPNFAPVYCLMTSEVDGFPIQQAIPLIPVGGAVQGAQTAQAVQPAQPMHSVLSSLGVPARLSGFYYLVDAILYLLRQPIETRCMTMEVYPTVARRYSTSPLAVERAIRTAINQSWQEQNIPLYCALSGRNPAPHEPRPTTCEFVANVLMFLRIHLAELKK